MKPDARRRRRQLDIPVAVLVALVSTAPVQAGNGTIVRDTTYRSASDFGPDTLLIRELEFENRPLSAAVDASSGVVVVAVPWSHRDRSNLAESRLGDRLLAYDVQARRVIWERSSQFRPLAARANRALLGRGTQAKLVGVADGEELGSIQGTPFVWGDGVALRITKDKICRWDLGSGDDLWSADREIGGTTDLLIRRDSVAYLVADGIQKIDVRAGVRWSYSIRASRKGLYSAPDGGTEVVRGLYGGSRATNLTAAPLIQGPDVYFAAETTVVRLESGSGAVRWSQNLTRQRGFSLKQRALGLPSTGEFLGRLVLRDAGANVAVASLGWAQGPKYLLRADPPTLALLAKSDGRVLARVQVPGITQLNDLVCTPVGCYLMAADRVLMMDDALKIRATFQAPSVSQPLGQFIGARDAIVLSTSSGIVSLSADSLKVVWSARCGRLLAIEPATNESKTRYAATTQGLIRLDEGDEPNAFYPLPGSWAELQDGWLLMGAGTKLRAATLVERRPTPSVD